MSTFSRAIYNTRVEKEKSLNKLGKHTKKMWADHFGQWPSQRSSMEQLTWGDRPTRKQNPDGWTLDRQDPETLGSRMLFATSASLHIWLCLSSPTVEPYQTALLESGPHSSGTLLSSNHDSFVSLHYYLLRKDEDWLKDRISNNGIQYRELR